MYDSAVQCLLKEQSDISEVAAERNKIELEINAAAQSRDFANAGRVSDTRDRYNYRHRRYLWW